MTGLNELEAAAMEMLLTGEHPVLRELRAQFEAADLEERELTGVGFFCNFRVPAEVKRLSIAQDFVLNDLNADISGLKNGAGFLLFVREGALQTLECYTVEEDWPETITSFQLHYDSVPRKFDFPT